MRSSKHRRHASLKLIDIERLGDEVVSAELEAEYGVALLRRGAANDDRGCCHSFEARAEHKAINVWKHQIKKYQVWFRAPHECSGFCSCRCVSDAVTAGIERIGHRPGDRGVVLDKHNSFGFPPGRNNQN